MAFLILGLHLKQPVINYGERGSKNGEITGPNLFAPHHGDGVKLFLLPTPPPPPPPPPIKRVEHLCDPYSMAKTSRVPPLKLPQHC